MLQKHRSAAVSTEVELMGHMCPKSEGVAQRLAGFGLTELDVDENRFAAEDGQALGASPAFGLRSLFRPPPPRRHEEVGLQLAPKPEQCDASASRSLASRGSAGVDMWICSQAPESAHGGA